MMPTFSCMLQRPCTCLSPDIVPPSVNNINGRKYMWNTQGWAGWVHGCETHLLTSHGAFICRGAITQQICSYIHVLYIQIHRSYKIVNGCLFHKGKLLSAETPLIETSLNYVVRDGSWHWFPEGVWLDTFVYFRLLGLSNYMIVCLVCMVLVKRSSGLLSR